MADKRINALTTTSASVGDDYFAIDGATNGTRALSAFSPTFGGNATVTGTLTTNGYTFTSGSLTSFSSTAGIYNYYSSGVGVLASYSDGSGTRAQTQISGSIVSLNTAAGNALTVSAAGVVAIPATTASTTTSTGALVVGNGTSGGLGVGGAINAGGAITSNNGSGSGLLGMRSSSGNASYVFWSETGVADRGILGFNNGSSTLSYRSGASSFSTGTEVFSVGSDGTITSTTSTNSGVLQLNLVNSSTGTSASSLFRFNAGTRTATLQAYNDTHATLAGQLRIGTSNGDIVLVPSGVASATFGASSTTFGSTVNVSVGNGTAATLGLNQTGVANAYLTQKATSGDLALGNGGGDQLTIAKTTGVVSITSSAISSNTSSGALVVSGGVGVAGNLSIGGDVLIDKSAIEVLLKRGANTNDGLIKFQTGILGDFAIGNRGTSDSDLHIYNYGTAADALKIAKSDSLATFAAAIRTAAPSGGTAANWKLGTVATVSPTSPNRTIEVDIGGTIYYIHAKTTNN